MRFFVFGLINDSNPTYGNEAAKIAKQYSETVGIVLGVLVQICEQFEFHESLHPLLGSNASSYLVDQNESLHHVENLAELWVHLPGIM